jgi:4-hydroxyphenylpyruvate dioxygenase-like putative hemolysin
LTPFFAFLLQNKIKKLDCEEAYNEAIRNGAIALDPPQQFSDEAGTVRIARVGTPFGDLVHTLIERHEYNGLFLPGFKRVEQGETKESPSLTHIDHIALALEENCAMMALDWYIKIFGEENKERKQKESEELICGVFFFFSFLLLCLKAFVDISTTTMHQKE